MQKEQKNVAIKNLAPCGRGWHAVSGEGLTKGFTLIELLVVVLIIGILAAVAVPQYQKAVEKSIMTEAIVNLRAIAKASQLYFLENGSYPTNDDLNALTIEIPHSTVKKLNGVPRIVTKDFAYSVQGSDLASIGIANRIATQTETTVSSAYYMYIMPTKPEKIYCAHKQASTIQKKLCNELHQTGIL